MSVPFHPVVTVRGPSLRYPRRPKGVYGASVGTSILDAMGVSSDDIVPRGIAMGASAHSIGTAALMEREPEVCTCALPVCPLLVYSTSFAQIAVFLTFAFVCRYTRLSFRCLSYGKRLLVVGCFLFSCQVFISCSWVFFFLVSLDWHCLGFFCRSWSA